MKWIKTIRIAFGMVFLGLFFVAAAALSDAGPVDSDALSDAGARNAAAALSPGGPLQDPAKKTRDGGTLAAQVPLDDSKKESTSAALEAERENPKKDPTLTVAANAKKSSSPFGVWSLLPALLAIVLALWTKQVLIALLGGIWSGVALQHGWLFSFPRTLDVLVQTAADIDKLKVIAFTLGLGGMVGIVSVSGGTKGIVQLVSRFAKDAKTGSVATWVMGMSVFFDDYASTLLTGSTMRPIADKVRISREKLSYIVDSTAAPIASLALVSTWIGYEVSVLGEAMKAANLPGDPYQIFLQGLPSRFYPVFALVFVLMVAVRGRDFGPMYHAEKRARSTGKVLRDGASPLMDAGLLEGHPAIPDRKPHAVLAIAPILSLIVAILMGLYVLGSNASYDALLYGSAVGVFVAGALPWVMKAMKLGQVLDAFLTGIQSTTMAILVLVLAWCVGKVMNDLEAGPYVAGLLGEALPAPLLPTVTFLLAAVMALATGTSWGTMAILFPIVIPVVAAHQGVADFQSIFLGTSSAVLAGAVFGDHCSPISDTTVLSSIASGADHVDHVRTQLPYALVCGGASVLLGTLPMGLGLSPWLSMLLGIGALWLVLHIFGKDAAA